MCAHESQSCSCVQSQRTCVPARARLCVILPRATFSQSQRSTARCPRQRWSFAAAACHRCRCATRPDARRHCRYYFRRRCHSERQQAYPHPRPGEDTQHSERQRCADPGQRPYKWRRRQSGRRSTRCSCLCPGRSLLYSRRVVGNLSPHNWSRGIGYKCVYSRRVPADGSLQTEGEYILVFISQQ